MPTALIAGLDPRPLTDPALPVNAERVRANMDEAIESLRHDGIDAVLLLASPTAEAGEQLRAAVRASPSTR